MKIHRQKIKHEREGHHANITDLKRSGPAESKIKVLTIINYFSVIIPINPALILLKHY